MHANVKAKISASERQSEADGSKMMFKALGRIWMMRKKPRKGGLWSPLFRDPAEKLSQDGAPRKEGEHLSVASAP